MVNPPSSIADAEEYELPEIHDHDLELDGQGPTSRSKGYEVDEEGLAEDEGLLSPSRRRRVSTSKDYEDHDHSDEEQEDSAEIVGKGTKIEQLIARSVPSTDDPSQPTLTLRVLLLGIFFCILGASASQVFYFKSNAPSFSGYFVILATYPLGHLLANEKIIPRGKKVFGWNLNPGKFGLKEAILVSVLSSSGASSAYAADILAIMDLYFKVPLSAVPSIILLLTTQCIGFGLAGMLQNLLVDPPAMYWPSQLVTVQLFTTLYPASTSAPTRSSTIPSQTSHHSAQTSPPHLPPPQAQSQRTLTLTRDRLRIFLIIFTVTFIYQFLPFLLFPLLTSIPVLCFIDNRNWWLRTLGSGYTGLGIGDWSLDWSSVGSSGPLFTPFWALGNWFGGLIGMVWIVMPVILLTNFWQAREFPSPLSAGLFNSTFQKFDVTSILNPDLSLNEKAWETAQPLLLTPYFAISYGFSFAALTSVLCHVWLWHRAEIMEALSNRTQLNDIHNKLMRAYPSVPSSWYMGLLALNFGAAVFLVKTTPLQMPIWALVLSIAIAAVFLVPVGIIAAVSNTTIGLNVLTEFVAGVLMPGKPIGNVTFKCYGYMAMSQALALTSDLKLGWYTSIPPREMFACQIIGTTLGALANYVTLVSVITSKRQYLDGSVPDPTAQWTGRAPGIFYSASIIWGAVAPARFFSHGYEVLYLGFLVGAAVPVIFWFAHKRWPGKKLNKVVFPIICNGASTLPQYPANIILTGLLTAIISNVYLAKKYPKPHAKYTYVISSALDAATSMTALCIYVLFGGVLGFTWDGPRWWGNSAVDSEHCIPGS